MKSIRIKAFITHKKSLSFDECADIFAINIANGMVDDDGDVILLVGRLKLDWGIAWMPI